MVMITVTENGAFPGLPAAEPGPAGNYYNVKVKNVPDNVFIMDVARQVWIAAGQLEPVMDWNEIKDLLKEK